MRSGDMNGWIMAAILLAFIGLAWTVDALLGTAALLIFGLVALVAPIVVFEGVGQVRRRLGG